MLNETYRAMLGNKSVIRETFMYGKKRAAEIGYENVFDYSLGNPSVPCPPEFTAAMQDLLANEEPVNLHGYCPSQGDPGFRADVAAHLAKTFGLPYEQKDIFPTTGAAGAIAHAIRAVTKPGDEVLTFAPYFPEYGPYVEGTGAHLRVVPPQAPAFQPNLEAFEQMLTEKVTCVLINTPNNPTGVVYSAETLSRLADILTERGVSPTARDVYAGRIAEQTGIDKKAVLVQLESAVRGAGRRARRKEQNELSRQGIAADIRVPYDRGGEAALGAASAARQLVAAMLQDAGAIPYIRERLNLGMVVLCLLYTSPSPRD